VVGDETAALARSASRDGSLPGLDNERK